MKRAIIVTALLLAAVPSHAISRYTSTSMGCAEVRATIWADGAAIMRYNSTRNPRLPLYNRYVRNDLFCGHDEYAKTVFIPAADTRQCPVYECEKVEIDDFPFFRMRRH